RHLRHEGGVACGGRGGAGPHAAVVHGGVAHLRAVHGVQEVEPDIGHEVRELELALDDPTGTHELHQPPPLDARRALRHPSMDRPARAGATIENQVRRWDDQAISPSLHTVSRRAETNVIVPSTSSVPPGSRAAVSCSTTMTTRSSSAATNTMSPLTSSGEAGSRGSVSCSTMMTASATSAATNVMSTATSSGSAGSRGSVSWSIVMIASATSAPTNAIAASTSSSSAWM